MAIISNSLIQMHLSVTVLFNLKKLGSFGLQLFWEWCHNWGRFTVAWM